MACCLTVAGFFVKWDNSPVGHGVAEMLRVLVGAASICIILVSGIWLYGKAAEFRDWRALVNKQGERERCLQVLREWSKLGRDPTSALLLDKMSSCEAAGAITNDDLKKALADALSH
ncbi:hypothetical protein NKJ26_21830 [Mesorhizobium sp. M0152]|uniref:hypothetical protein n=1 Tax=Mesorhizobium sp. M0152 TaxID=2956898 RepID=UPI003337F023